MRDWLITDITPQKKQRDRVNLHFPDFVLGASLFLLTKYDLGVGEKIGEKKLIAFWEKEIEERITNKALFLLSFRPRSEREMAQRLKMYLRKSEPGLKKAPLFLQLKTDQMVGKTILSLKKKNLLSDLNFVEWWVAQRASFRPRSLLQIRMELRRKGVDQKIIEQGLEKAGFDEQKMAKALLKKKLRTFRGGGDKKGLSVYLVRKGFPYKLVKDLIDEKDNLA